MAKIRVRLSEKDRPEHERGDEWFTVDAMLGELDELPWDELDAIERQLDTSVMWLVEVERRGLTVRYWRALVWLARRFGGVDEPYAQFKPNVRRLETESLDDDLGAGDADPPGGTPPTSAGSGGSPKLSTSSTPRSRARTGSRPGKSAA